MVVVVVAVVNVRAKPCFRSCTEMTVEKVRPRSRGAPGRFFCICRRSLISPQVRLSRRQVLTIFLFWRGWRHSAPERPPAVQKRTLNNKKSACVCAYLQTQARMAFPGQSSVHPDVPILLSGPVPALFPLKGDGSRPVISNRNHDTVFAS